MDFTLTADQASLAAALDGLAAQFQAKPIEFRGFALVSEVLERRLAEAEFFDIAATPGLGPVAAALSVERLARLPYSAEVALSMLVRPHVMGGRLPRPLAFVARGRPGRFVAGAKSVLIADGDELGVAELSSADVQPVESIYAYPMGKLTRIVEATRLSASEAAEARKWLRIALAAEAAGLIQAAIDSTVEHLTMRKQFGRPLGSFQALRHRMAECAVLAGGVKLLALKAASTATESDAALAAFHAQESGSRIAYDLHQFLGAMGMTLEHPLHLWTYRLKLLLSELGGQCAQAHAVVQHCFA
ncbi:MAG TPA: acyl-CoA dehydrogenase family protein [Polyangiales bacterium]|nr:acyl-CoA dehydrogenase family protein [Polyangiales bacterium]